MAALLGSPRTDLVATTLARGRLGVPAVVFFVMSAAAPLTVVAGVVTTGYAVTGVTGLPLAFLVIGGLLALFSVGYVAMARQVANAGAFYAYVAHGLGRPLAVGVAWVALLAYNALQVGLYGAVGAATAWFGWDVPWLLVALAAWLLVAALGVLRVDINGTVLAILLVAEVVVIVVYDLVQLANPAGGSISASTLSFGNLIEGQPGVALGLTFLGFVGFEAAVVYSEEARHPRRTIPAATYLSVGIIAVLYAGSAWAMSVATGPDQVVAEAKRQGPELIFNVAATHLGKTAADVGHALFLTSLLAAMISFHNTCARYAFALGREHVLPGRFGRTAPRSHAPVVGSLLQSLIGLVVIVAFGVAGWDPLVRLFFWGGTTGGYGVLLLVTATSIAVIGYGLRHPQHANLWRRLVAPCLAAAGLLAVAGLATWQLPALLGVTPDSPVRWTVYAVYLTAAFLGLLWGLVLKQARPRVYARIGHGAKAAITTGLSPVDDTSSDAWANAPTQAQEPVQ